MMIQQKLISVIVPVYNAEKYLRKCVESLMSQTYRNLEIILVNDGSKDNSGVLCEELLALDSRIKVIHQKNLGVSTARNNGLKYSNGEYVGFVDSDDYVNSSMYMDMALCLESNKCDLVYCDLQNVDNNNIMYDVDTIISVGSSKKMDINEINEKQLIELAGSACRALYRKELIKKFKIEFPDKLKFSEDRIFNLLYLSKIDSLYYLKKPLYYRLVDENTTVQRYHEDHYERVKEAYITTKNLRDLLWMVDGLEKAIDRQFINNVYGSLNNYFYRTSKLSYFEKYKILKRICNDQLVRGAISNIDYNNIRDRLLQNKSYILLSIITKLSNLKNGK